MERLPTNPPDLVTATTPTGSSASGQLSPVNPTPPISPVTPPNVAATVKPSTPPTAPCTPPPPFSTTNPLFHHHQDQDQNMNRLADRGQIKINIDINPNQQLPSNLRDGVGGGSDDIIYENKVKFFPSSPKDMDVMKNIRKVYVSRVDDASCGYKVLSEGGETLFETVQGETDGSLWSRYFRQQQSVILIKDRFGKGVLKLDFGRSRTVSCCTTLRFAAVTAHFKSRWEEPLGVIFKDRGCCVYSCCSTEVTYESVPQHDAIHPFTVKTKRQWRNRAEFMVKHSDGSILAFIDKEKKCYTLTMGENLKPMMKANLIAFVIGMDIMDREDAGRLNCYLRPSTYVTILFLLMLFFMIGAFLFHFLTAMILAWPKKGGVMGGCMDEIHIAQDDPFLPHNHTHNSGYPDNFPQPLQNITVAHDI